MFLVDRRTKDLEVVPRPEGRNEAGAAEGNVGEMNRAKGIARVAFARKNTRARQKKVVQEQKWMARTIDARCVGLAALGLR